ncbi:Dihydrolipoyllysine-residue acetyltransferase component of pyruvate dehydrogenase complex [Blochmannia endosymbiont of Camponotus (Colobopsis) obliquus]|nr:2-oxo acid dehydrogenase subunit E2 [Blochmannia endosymbiont of Camponotus (Colobopsis) obliquus]AKC60325.1 Dihydrolipoyllysine-residue acetyltransferase component of pyruvate dehydrogenase complex [Blochmannia endosymbiont of Camponotus (Colobopsis) obliquus]
MAIAMNMPDIGVDIVEVIEVMVQVGDYIKINQSLIVVEGEKAAMEVPSLFSGIVQSIMISVGDKISTGTLIMMIDIKDEVEVLNKSTDKVDNFSSSLQQNNKEKLIHIDNLHNIYASPLVRRMAREFGLDLSKIKGSGRKGRILREDIQSYIKNILGCDTLESNSSTVNIWSNLLPWPSLEFQQFGNTQEVELSRAYKVSGANLHRNWVMVPHVTQFDEVDITDLEEFRKQQNVDLKKNMINIKITLLIFVMKAVAKALEKWPRFNSSLSKDGQKLILKKYINIGIAVDTISGLYVPVFRDVNKKGIIDLSCELAKVSKKVHSGKKFAALDLQGGSFTISSLGGVGGGTAFTPIINAPEVAILGISRSLLKPVWNGEKFVPRLMLPLSLSYDHRVINGADGVRFISLISKLMSDIRHLIM